MAVDPRRCCSVTHAEGKSSKIEKCERNLKNHPEEEPARGPVYTGQGTLTTGLLKLGWLGLCYLLPVQPAVASKKD